MKHDFPDSFKKKPKPGPRRCCDKCRFLIIDGYKLVAVPSEKPQVPTRRPTMTKSQADGDPVKGKPKKADEKPNEKPEKSADKHNDKASDAKDTKGAKDAHKDDHKMIPKMRRKMPGLSSHSTNVAVWLAVHFLVVRGEASIARAI